MAEFTGNIDSNSTVNEKEDSGPGAFFRRLRKGVAESVRPIPNLAKLMLPDNGETNNSSQSNTTLNGTKDSMIRDCSSSSNSNSLSLAHTPYRLSKFEQFIAADNIDLSALKKLSWNGVPQEHRAIVWQVLLGYIPTNKSRRDPSITRKRKEYMDSIVAYYDVINVDNDRSVQEGELIRQILVDLPRTSPDNPFFHHAPIQKAMERILYIWATRHPASGYVQGMNDLLTPLLVICMSSFIDGDVLRCDVKSVSADIIMNMECDAYWCLTKLLDNIQDHYTDGQPGLQRMGLRLEDLMRRIDAELHAHFEAEGLMYVQFSFRWMNCLLLRELPLRVLLRLWDAYLSEEKSGFENFHVYVCAVMLKTFREMLLPLQFQEMIMFLQDLPTREWREEDIEPMLSQAYILSTLFDDCPSHLM